MRQRTPLGVEAAQYMESGELVPDSLMIQLLLDDVTSQLEEGKSLLLDGFPRNLEQAMALEEATHIDHVVNLDIPTETIVERIADRWIHPASGRIYSYAYKPPKVEGLDDITGEPLVQREDDKPESVRTRLEAYDQVCCETAWRAYGCDGADFFCFPFLCLPPIPLRYYVCLGNCSTGRLVQRKGCPQELSRHPV